MPPNFLWGERKLGPEQELQSSMMIILKVKAGQMLLYFILFFVVVIAEQLFLLGLADQHFWPNMKPLTFTVFVGSKYTTGLSVVHRLILLKIYGA